MAKAGLLFVGTDDGALLFSNPNNIGRWLRIGQPFRGQVVRAIWPLPDNPLVVFAAVQGQGLQRSDDGGQSWHPATGRSSWSYFWTPTAVGSFTIQVRATDDSLNTQPVTTSVSVTVNGSSGSVSSTWSALATPANPAVSDNNSVELGMKFRSDVSGQVLGVRFYKGLANTGMHIAVKAAGESAPLAPGLRERWRGAAGRAFAALDDAVAGSVLPDEPPNRAEVEDWLVSLRRARLGA